MNPLLPKVAAFCAYQERSRPEIEEKLLTLEIPETEWESIFTFLEKERYFSEKRFAHSFIGGKFRQKQWGKRKILFEIRPHKIPFPVIQQALLEEIPDESYAQTIETLVLKKIRENKKEASYQLKSKIARYLLQKGFTWEEFGEILNSCILD
ncbi:MAG: RecX family transcriptional regulator [Bacteroidia bacterium]|nr:RecX family transcriptional regulator [Bacteroidia bacterium]